MPLQSVTLRCSDGKVVLLVGGMRACIYRLLRELQRNECDPEHSSHSGICTRYEKEYIPEQSGSCQYRYRAGGEYIWGVTDVADCADSPHDHLAL